MSGLVGFMNGAWGRLARAALGLALIGYGLAVPGGTTGVVLAAVGLVPLLPGLAGRCLLEPLAGRASA